MCSDRILWINHYLIPQSFALNPGQPTMKLKDPRLEALVDTAETFTHNDLKEITLAYQCAGKDTCQTKNTDNMS